jgi:hypothetical protein
MPKPAIPRPWALDAKGDQVEGVAIDHEAGTEVCVGDCGAEEAEDKDQKGSKGRSRPIGRRAVLRLRCGRVLEEPDDFVFFLLIGAAVLHSPP